jgi:acid phosphatase (class A)
MTPRITIATAAAVLLLAGGGVWTAFAADAPPSGYLPAPLDTTHILQPAPTPGTSRYEADRTIYLQTRSLKDSDRWILARDDADSAKILQQFSCSAGLALDKDTAPRLAAVLLRMRKDVSESTNAAKDVYKRKRPYLIDEGPICIDKTDSLAASPDYPSGHTTWGWSVGLILAELLPDRTSNILLRARSIGESRVVCGVHNSSAVEAGRTNASAVIAALHGQDAFRKDLDAARKEMADLRKSGKAPDATACSAEAALLAKDPY